MKKLLVGIDLSKSGYVWLMTRAQDLAECLKAKVDLVYIAKKSTAEQSAQYKTSLDELMAHIDKKSRGKTEVVEGEIVKTLEQLSNDYDALVVGPREPAGVRKWFENPIAVKVIAACGTRSPVFVPRVEQHKRAFSKILLGVDAGELTHNRIASTKQWAQALGAKIDVVYCSQSLSKHIEQRIAQNIARDQLEAAKKQQQEEFKILVGKELDAATLGEAIVYDAAPGPGMVELSKDYDLVVVGTADIKRSSTLLGAVSSYVVRNAQCDVLTLP